MEKSAKRIIDYVGGKENVSYFARCMSRLRFELKDKACVNLTELKKMREILCVVRCGEEFCFVIKKGLPYLYMAIKERLGKREDDIKERGYFKYILCYKWIVSASGFLCMISFFLEINRRLFPMFFITAMMSFFTGILTDYLLGFVGYKDDEESDFGIEIMSPLKGRVISENGNGFIRIYPHTNIAVSPVDGIVEDILPHAFLIRSDSGFGVFVHIGVDTINMGKCFIPYVRRGDFIKRGDAIVEFDAKELIRNGYDLSSYAEILDYDRRWNLSVISGYATGGRGFVKLMEK